MARLYHRAMVAPRAFALTIALALAACTSPATLAPSPSGSGAGPTSTTVPAGSGGAVPLPQTSFAPDMDLAAAIAIAPPYELDPPSSSEYDNLSGQIQGLPFDLAQHAGSGYAPADFPMGFRFVREGGNLVGVVALVGMPDEVAAQPGLLESIAAATAAEANARLSYETIGGLNVGIVRGPIASALVIVDGRLVFAQTGQPSVAPEELMTAVIAASGESSALDR